MSWLMRRRFLVLLVTLVVFLVVYPMLRGLFDARLLLDALITAVFLGSLLVVFGNRYTRLIGLVLGIPTIAGLWTGYALPELPEFHLAVVFHANATLFLIFIVGSILRIIHSEENVSADSIYGAFCGYLLTGLAFGHIYCLVESASAHSFHASAALAAQISEVGRRQFVLSYFSFITLTTLGYGDITPASEAARAFAVVEAILGQFYVAVLMAELIGKKVAHSLTGP